MIVSDFLIKSSSLFNIDLEIKKSSKQFIDNNSRVITSDHVSNLFVQNAISKKLFFLVEGQAELYHESKNELLGANEKSQNIKRSRDHVGELQKRVYLRRSMPL